MVLVYIYANIGGILMVNVTIYSSTMDPMGYIGDAHPFESQEPTNVATDVESTVFLGGSAGNLMAGDMHTTVPAGATALWSSTLQLMAF